MTDSEKVPKPGDEADEASEFEKFEKLTKGLLSVTKKDLDEARAREDAEKG